MTVQDTKPTNILGNVRENWLYICYCLSEIVLKMSQGWSISCQLIFQAGLIDVFKLFWHSQDLP